MTKSISRRDFIKLAGAGAAATAVLTGCGPASRYVKREPYTKMPEYTYNGLSTYFATTCRECSAGCGLVVRTMQGRAIKVEGNKNNPVNQGKTCARGQVTLQGLYNPDRVQNPGKHTRGSNTWSSAEGSGFQEITWIEAVNTVSNAISANEPGEIAFLLGMAPDHLFDLVVELTETIQAPPPVRFGALGMFEARTTLRRAGERVLGTTGLPFFDMGEADVVFSFGANFLETWLSPVAQTREFARFRQRNPRGRGYLVQFEARMSQTGAKADEWIPSRPGSEAQLVLAIGRLVAERRGLTRTIGVCQRGCGGGRRGGRHHGGDPESSGGCVFQRRTSTCDPRRRGACTSRRAAGGRGRAGAKRIGGQSRSTRWNFRCAGRATRRRYGSASQPSGNAGLDRTPELRQSKGAADPWHQSGI